MKHLLYEHQNNISELKAESSVALKLAQEDHRVQEAELRKDKRSLKESFKEQELSHEDSVKNLIKVIVYGCSDLSRLSNDAYLSLKHLQIKAICEYFCFI